MTLTDKVKQKRATVNAHSTRSTRSMASTIEFKACIPLAPCSGSKFQGLLFLRPHLALEFLYQLDIAELSLEGVVCNRERLLAVGDFGDG